MLEWLPFLALLVAYDYARGAVTTAPAEAHIDAVAMGFVLVYGGEHFVLDIVVGWAYALAALAIVSACGWALRRYQKASDPSG